MRLRKKRGKRRRKYPETDTIPEHLTKIIDYAISYIGDETDNWFRIKKELVNLFPPSERSRFSRRHYSTKKHIISLFDKLVITYWEEKVNIKLWVDPEKLHPEDWIRRPRGWGLKRFNEKQAKRRAKKRTTSNSN